MTTLRAKVRDRRLELNVPADWPDGIEVEIHPLGQGAEGGEMSAAEIAATLAAMDRVDFRRITFCGEPTRFRE